MTARAPALPADLEAGLRRLRLSAMRRLALELLVPAKAQRWSPEEPPSLALTSIDTSSTIDESMDMDTEGD